MTENKRYIVKGSDDFFQHIEDTTLTEDKHEGIIYNIYQVVKRLNEQEELIKRLKTIREEQTETILKQKRKIQELELCNQCKYIYGIHGGSND